MFSQLARWQPHELSGGHAGLALLFDALAATFPGEKWDVAARAHLEVAVEAADDRPHLTPGLFQGLAGVDFAVLMLGGEAHFDDRLLPEIEGVTHRVAASKGELAVDDFDTISGLAGLGAYLLTRGSERSATEGVLAALVSLAGAGWSTPHHLLHEASRDHYPAGYLNCGLAHGIPGPLGVLAIAEHEGIRVDGSVEAIRRIADWLQAQRLHDEWGTTWPSAVSLGSEEPMPTRSAWCYGAPGVARALWLAGEAVDEPAYRDLAVEAMKAVYRRPLAERRIDAPTFCHGVAGLLQITLRFGRDTGLPLFAEAAAQLTGQLLDAYDPDSVLGYRDLEPDGRLVDRPGLLEGATGVALVLLAASSPRAPAWDRLFLLS